MQDVGHAILESYSRIIESLAFTVLSRIDDVMLIDSQARNDSGGNQATAFTPPKPLSDENGGETPNSKTTLLDFMGWENGEVEAKKEAGEEADSVQAIKPATMATNRRFLEKLENLSALRSPTSRH